MIEQRLEAGRGQQRVIEGLRLRQIVRSDRHIVQFGHEAPPVLIGNGPYSDFPCAQPARTSALRLDGWGGGPAADVGEPVRADHPGSNPFSFRDGYFAAPKPNTLV